MTLPLAIDAPAARHLSRRFTAANLPAAVLLAVVLAAPDFLMRAVAGVMHAVYTPGIALALLLFGLLLASCATRPLLASILLLLGLLETARFCYMAYFGGVLDANVLLHGLAEFRDVASGGAGVIRHLAYAPLVVLLPYLAGWLLLRPLLANRVLVPHGWILLLGLTSIIPWQIMRSDSLVRYYPVDVLPSAVNSFLTANTLLFRRLALAAADPERYRPIRLVALPVPERVTVVIVMNESLTPDHMSLFGYRRNTTPQLAALRSDPHFVCKEGIAAGVGTLSSFYSFWNGVRDPRNVRAFVEQQTNLFRLAKQHGFRTVYLSSQGANLLRGAGAQYIDQLITIDSRETQYQHRHDEMLVDLLPEVSLGARNFIVLHLRSAHGPYASNYALRPELAVFRTDDLGYLDYQRATYDDAVRYNDWINVQLIDAFRARVADPLYLFITSDHGQLLGEDVRHLLGHGQLLPEVARVPVLLYQQHGDPAIAGALRQIDWPTHYEMTELVARLLGFEIRDPNGRPGTYFINGTGYHGSAGLIRVRKSPAATPPRYDYLPATSTG